MSTDKMREEFEAWWRSDQLKTFPSWYPADRLDAWGSAYKPAAWSAWQASRAALVVELPPRITPEDAGETADIDDERAYTVAHMVNGAIAACGEFIKAAGITIK